jgi:hypothetical protein
MPSHKFRIGETVYVRPAISRNVPGGAYVVTKQLPVCTENQILQLVMKTAEDRSRCDDSEAINRARERGIFAQRAMNSRLVVRQ